MRRTGNSVSLLAMAAMLVGGPSPLIAQSFNATGTVVGGSAFISESAGQTLIEVNQPNAVINWVPNAAAGSGPINFQPVGTTALFTNLDQPNFAVLNRILPADPARPVVFNGTVISQLQDPASGAISRGGTVFFYSPGGILVGSTGVFNVGSLALTSSDLAYDPVTGAFSNAGRYSFLPANAGSSVEIRPGAQIIAGPFASYVALVAPKVVNSGTITVDGSAVLVAADASTITFRPNGLFDIQIDQGTSAAGEVVTNDGTITGSAGTINSSHRIYVVAVPKNDAITMAIKGGSNLGFDVAAAADVDGNAIVLSAGYDVAGGEVALTRSGGGGAFPADLEIGAINATSNVTGRATGQASLVVDGGASANFASNVSLSGVSDPGSIATDGAFVSVAGVGSTLDIVGDLAVTALDGGAVNGTASSDSGNARVVVDQGSLTVGGDVSLDVGRNPRASVDTVAGQAVFAATNGAVVDIGRDLFVAADGIGPTNTDAAAFGPNPGGGGTARISFAGGSDITVGGDLTVRASGFGGGTAATGFAGTAGSGGNAVIEGAVGAGTFRVNGAVTLDARGVGGDGLYCTTCTVEGGTGTGGTAGIIAATGSRFELGGVVTIDASGIGGNAVFNGGKAGGAAQGGSAFVSSTGGVIAASSGLTVQADANGGAGALNDTGISGSTGFGGDGGAAIGGIATLSAGDPDALALGGAITVVGDTVVSANGTGGLGGNGAAGTGGFASVTARDGSIVGEGLSVLSLGQGGNGASGGSGGAGTGGSADVIALSALEGDSTVTFGTAGISVRGTGGAGSTPGFGVGSGGVGGAGTGGQARVLAEAGNGILGLGVTTINAGGRGGTGGGGGVVSTLAGGDGGAGGDGRGGSAQIGVISGLDTGTVNTGSASFGDPGVASSATVSVIASGNGGTGGAGGTASVSGAGGSGGSGAGGAAGLTVQGGVVNLQGSAEFLANGFGGNGGVGTGGGAGGNATVGGLGGLLDTRGVSLVGGSRAGHADQKGQLNANDLLFAGNPFGGSGSAQGTANVLGHPLTFRLDGASINATSLGFFAATGDAAPGLAPSVISLSDGNTTLSGAFAFGTQGTLTAAMGSGAQLFSDTATITASDWLSGPVPAGVVGTIHGTTSVTLTTGGDLFGNLSVDTQGSLALTAGGLVRLDNLSAGGAISVGAGTTIALGNLAAGTTVSVTAPGNVTVANVSSVGDTTLNSGAALAAGSVTSRQSALLRGTGSLTLAGNVIAGAAVRLSSNGLISAQGLSAGLVNPSVVSGASYDVTVVGLGGIGLGNVSSAHDIKLFTPLAMTAGALSGREIAVLATGAQSIGSIAATGRVMLADYGMVPLGGDPLGSYDIDPVLSNLPSASGGPITVSGIISAGALAARSSATISLQGITTTAAGTATGVVNVRSGSALSAGAIAADGIVGIVSGGTMDLTSVSSGAALSLTAGQAMTAGPLQAQGEVIISGFDRVALGTVRSVGAGVGVTGSGTVASGAISAQSSISIGSLTASVTTGDMVATNGSIGVGATGDITTGLMASEFGDVAAQAGGNLTTGNVLSSNNRVVLIAGGAASLGNLTAGGAGTSTFGLRVSAGTTLGLGNVSVGTKALELTSGGTLTAGSLSANAGPLTVTSGGNLTLTGLASSGSGDVVFDVTGALAARGVTAAGRIGLTATGAITTEDLTATGALDVRGTALALGNLSGSAVTIDAGTTLGAGTVTALAGDATLGAAGDLATGAITASGAASLASVSGSVAAGAVTSTGGPVTISSSTGMNLASASAGTQLTLTSGGTLTAGSLSANAGPLTVTSGGNLTLTGLASSGSGDVVFDVTGALAARGVTAGGRIGLTATGAITTEDLTATGALDVRGTALALGNLSGSAVTIDAGTTLGAGTVTALAGDATLGAAGDLAAGAVTASGAASLVSTGGGIAAGAVTSTGNSVTITSSASMNVASASAGTQLTMNSGGALTSGALSGTNGVNVTGLGAVTTGSVQSAAGGVTLTAANALGTGAVAAQGPVSLTSTLGGVAAGDLSSAGGSVGLTARGAGSAGIVTAASGIAMNAGSTLDLTSAASVGGDVTLEAVNALRTGAVSTGGAISLISTGAGVAAGDLTSTGASVSLNARDAGSAGAVTAANGISMSARSTLGLTSATSAAGDVVLDATTNLTAGDLVATGGRLLLSAGGTATLGNLNAGGLAGNVGLRVSTGTGLAMGNATATAGELRLVSGGTIVAGNLSANGGALNAISGSTLRAGTMAGRDGLAITAGGDTTLTGAASSTAGNVTFAVTGALASQTVTASAGLIDIQATGSANTGNLTAGTAMTVNTGGALVTGDLRGASVGAVAGTNLQTGAVTATGGAVSLTAANDLTTGAVTASGAVAVLSNGGSVTAGSVTAGGNLSVLASRNLQAGALTAGERLDAGGANVTLGNVRADTQLNVSASGTLVADTVESVQGEVQMFSVGAMRTGAITGASAVKLGGQGAVTTGDLTANGAVLVNTDGDVTVGAARSRNGTVELRSNAGSLTIGAVTAATDMALAAANDLSTGNVNARDMLLLAGGNVRTGSLTSPDGRILVASNTLVTLGGPAGEYNFDAAFAAPLRATGGTLTLGGPVSGGSFTAAVRDDANLLGITASRSILVQSGGTASLGGVLRAPQIELRSNDLVMPAGSGLNAGLTGTISLVSGNAAGMRIGDGLDTSILPATSYTLDNAEWGRINSGSLSLFAIDGAGPVTILIGKLDMTGPDAGSTIDDPTGRVLFRTGESPTATPTGTIRVVGAVRGTGFRAGNALVFETGQFQLASDTGSINLLGRDDAPLGSLQIAARDIHIAATPLLARLAADPFFAGVEPALDAVSAGGDGPVLRAGALDLTVGRTFYIQRTGAGGDPLGFEEPLDGFRVRLAGATPITVIINGTFRTASGLVSGVDAWRLFKDSGVDLSGFTAESRLNGCLLNAATCGVVPPLDPGPDPDPGFRTLVELLDNPPIDDTPRGDPDDEREQPITNAILPPQSVLSVQPEGLPTQLDEPIAGSGNPALIGAGVGGVALQ